MSVGLFYWIYFLFSDLFHISNVFLYCWSKDASYLCAGDLLYRSIIIKIAVYPYFGKTYPTRMSVFHTLPIYGD